MRTHGQIETWSRGYMAMWLHGHTDTVYRHVDLWAHGHVVTWSLETWSRGHMSCRYFFMWIHAEYLYNVLVFQLPRAPPHPCPGKPGPLDEGSNSVLVGIYSRYILSYTGSRGKQEIYAEIEFYKYGYKDSLIHGYNIVRRTIGTIFCWEYCVVHRSRGTNCREMTTVAPDNLWFLNHLWSSL